MNTLLFARSSKNLVSTCVGPCRLKPGIPWAITGGGCFAWISSDSVHFNQFDWEMFPKILFSRILNSLCSHVCSFQPFPKRFTPRLLKSSNRSVKLGPKHLFLFKEIFHAANLYPSNHQFILSDFKSWFLWVTVTITARVNWEIPSFSGVQCWIGQLLFCWIKRYPNLSLMPLLTCQK